MNDYLWIESERHRESRPSVRLCRRKQRAAQHSHSLPTARAANVIIARITGRAGE